MLKVSLTRILAGLGSWARSGLALAVAALVLIFAALPSTASAGNLSVSGALGLENPTEAGRISRNGVPSACGSSKSNPGTLSTSTAYGYASYSFTNTTGASVCYTVTLTTSTTNLFVVAYQGSFSPAVPGTNYLGDAGASSSLEQFGIDVPAGATIFLVVSATTVPADTSSFTLTATATSPPTVTGVSPTSGPTAGGTSVVITGTNFTGATAVKFGATNATSFTVDSATQITAVSSAASAGTADVTVTNPGGTSATSSSDQFVYLSPPIIAAAFSPNSIAAGSTSVLTLTITNPNSVALTGIGFSNTYPAGITPILIGAYTCTPGSALFNGSGLAFSGVTLIDGGSCQVPVTVRASTAAVYTNTTSAPTSTNGGTGSAASATLTVTAATPTVTSISPNVAGAGTSVTITGTNFTGATAVKFGTTDATTFTVNSATSITATAPAGTGTVDVTVTTAGGTSSTVAGDRFTYYIPTVTGISPAVGPTAGQIGVTIDGTNFTSDATVKFGTTAAASVFFINDTQISALAPAGTGTVDVTVTTPYGTSATSSADRFTYLTGPQLTMGYSPTSINIGGSSTLTVTIANANSGSAFTSVYTEIQLPNYSSANGAPSSACGGTLTPNGQSVLLNNATVAANAQCQFTATISGFAAGALATTGYVYTAEAGTTTGSATLTVNPPALAVTGISPTTGPASGGTSVVITGTAFTGTTAVKFGATNATSFVVNSATQITAVAPAGAAGAVDVTVTTPIATSAATSADRFTYVAAPTVTAVSPNLGPPGGGTLVTITGTNFATATVVKFGTSAPVQFDVISDTQISARAPAGSGTVDITVLSQGGTSALSSADRFTYTTPLTTTQAVASTTLTLNVAATAFTPVTSSGGFGTVSYALSGGSLPTGLAFNTATGQITGTPTATLAATTFTVTATDSAPTPQTSSKTFSLTVTVPAPVAAAKTISVGYQTAFTFDLTNDITGAATSLTVATQPGHGAVTTTGLTLTYTPANGYSGADSFTYTATGPGGTSAAKTVTVSVNGAPVALARTVTVQPDPSKTGATVPPIVIDLTGNVQNAVSIIISTQPAHGTVTVNGFVVTYTPNPGFFGADSFSYQAVGPAGSVVTGSSAMAPLGLTSGDSAAAPSGPVSAPATVSISLATPAITAPPLSATVLQGKPVTVNLTDLATGGPFTAATVVSVSPSGAGTTAIVAQGSGFALQFTSAGTFSGTATITYTLSNSFSTSLPGQVVITVQSRPDPTLDPDVKGLISAEVEDARNFASIQMQNFNQRMEQLHQGAGPSGSSVQLNFAAASVPLGAMGPTSGAWSYWVSGTIDLAKRTASGGVATDLSTQGISAGLDMALTDQWSFGLGGGFSRGNNKIGTAGTRLDISNGGGAIYGSWHTGRGAYVDMVAGFGALSYDTTRFSAPGSVFLTGSRSGRETFASVTSGFDFETDGGWLLAPYGRITALRGSLDGYTETGSTTWALSYDPQSLSSVNGTIGGHAQRTFAFDGGQFTPKVRVEYQWELKDLGAFAVRYADWAASPTYTGALLGIDKGRLVVGAGADVKIGKANFNLDYSTTANSGLETEQRITVGGSLRF